MTGAAPAAPAAAAWVFGDALPPAERYVARLAADGVTRGLIGPREVPRLWERHVLNSAAVAEAVPRAPGSWTSAAAPACPGIPLGLARPDLTMTLVEPMARRVEFLEEAVAELARATGRVRAGASSADGPRSGRSSARRAGRRRHRPGGGAAPPARRLVPRLMRPGTQLVALVGARALEELPALLPELDGRRDAGRAAAGRRCRAGDAATTVVVMTREHGDAPRGARPTCSTWNRYSHPIRST